MVREAAEAAVSSVEAALAKGESPERAMAYGSEEGTVVVDAIEVGGEAAMAALEAELGPAAVAAASRAASEAIKGARATIRRSQSVRLRRRPWLLRAARS